MVRAVRVVPPLSKSKKYPKADGLLTDAANQPLVIYTADCVPIFMSANKGRVVGMLHAGWRGTRSEILKKGGPSHLNRRWGIASGGYSNLAWSRHRTMLL